MMLDRNIENPPLPYNASHFHQGVFQMLKVVKNPDNQTDVKSVINERQAVEVGTNEKNVTALDLCREGSCGMLEIAHGVVNDDSMFSTLMVVDRIAAKPTPQVDKPVSLSNTLKQTLQDVRLRPLFVVPASPEVTVVVVIFIIVGKYGTNLFLVNLMCFLNNHSSPLIHIRSKQYRELLPVSPFSLRF